MSYNTPYKKGKFTHSAKAKKADFSKTAWKNLTDDPNLWATDTRKYDLIRHDTGPDYAFKSGGTSSANRFRKIRFKYKAKSKLKQSKKSNRKYRRYWY